MTFLEMIMKDNIFIDFDSEVLYGSDQMYVDYPLRFATVGFQLIETSLLGTVADRIRKDMGLAPMQPMDEYTDHTCDQEGWYDFYYGISDIDGGRGDSVIEFVVVNSQSRDNEEKYTIDLTDEEREALYNRIDEQCRIHLMKNCRDLLDEAKAEMEAYDRYEELKSNRAKPEKKRLEEVEA